MKILITGGAGYIGYSLVKQLLEDVEQLHSITIFDNLSRRNYSFFTEAKFNHKPIRLIQGDILDGRTLQKALEGMDWVVHLAAKVTTPFADADAHSFDQINHWGTAQLAYAIENSSVSKIIYLSSIAIYGDGQDPLTEESAPLPQSFYGRSKWEGEKQLNVLHRDRKVFILRSGNVYGYNPSYRIDAVVNRFMFQANFLGKITVNGNGDQHRSFIHVDKVANTLVQVIDGKLDPGTYNLVEHNFSINDITSRIQMLYPKLDIIHANYNLRMKDVITSVPCKIWNTLELRGTTFEDELLDFKQHFSF
ncbi:MAG TPA: NAD-dependent epimerase/dehydratase [Saprospiraceae bacterium]|nr:NAD-dependent epimerase/dehydratase [Saprospiraceae bacterium]